MQNNKTLTAVGCDIRDAKFISSLANVFSSASLAGARSKQAGHALFTLLALSMVQIPAASIEADDETIANLCFLSAKEWSEVKNQVLKHFTPCDDGRYYSNALSPIVNDIYADKQKKAAFIEKQRLNGKKASHKKGPIVSEPFANESIAIVKTIVNVAKPSAEIAHVKSNVVVVPSPDVFELVMSDSVVELKAKAANAAKTKSNEAEAVFNYWAQVMGKNRVKFDDKRKRLIISRLKDYSADDLILAIDGCKMSGYHMGENEHRTTYNELSLIFRNSEKIEYFMNRVNEVFKPQVSKQLQTTMNSLDAVFGKSEEQNHLFLE